MTVFKDRLPSSIPVRKRKFSVSRERLKQARKTTTALLMFVLTMLVIATVFSWLERSAVDPTNPTWSIVRPPTHH